MGQSTARANVEALEAFLSEGHGVGQVTIDGVTTRYERNQALEELRYWRRRLAEQTGRRRRARSIDLTGF